MMGVMLGVASTWIMAGTAAATVGTEIYEAVSKPSIPQPLSQDNTAEQTAQMSQASALAQAQALTKRRGMAATMLTSPTGTTGSAAVGKATLGG